MTADLSHIDIWLFDLDHTLYPPECGLMGMVDVRMDAYVERVTGLIGVKAQEARHQFYVDHGTTLAGLREGYGVDPAHFIAEVQQVDFECVRPSPQLRAGLERLPGRRLVFTNAGIVYAQEVLRRLAIADLFEDVFAIEHNDYVPKPQRATFEKMITDHAVTPASAIFFEDSARNLKPAADLGMTTVLVGPKPLETGHAFVHHHTDDLTTFLTTALVKEPRP